MTDWNIQRAREMYHVMHWSDGFFDINDKGRMCVYPKGSKELSIDLFDLANQLNQSGIKFPVLLRFTDILHQRIKTLNDAFMVAIQKYQYQGTYLSAYPIKVNQQRHVVEAIIKNGQFPVSLETGSKPELLAALGVHSDLRPMIICNGYKDREYIRLALISQKLGRKVYIILEKMSELLLALEEAEKLKIEPRLGVRVRLASVGVGKWQDSGGEKSKFGFSAPQLLQIIEILQERKQLSLLRVLHFHLGSQVANIADIQRGMHEGVRYYETLRALGVPIDTIDVGGGLGVDYEGTKSHSFCSKNYSIQEYANHIVCTILNICRKHHLPHPEIVTESGRAITAHHALLITDVISVESACYVKEVHPPDSNYPPILHDLWFNFNRLSESTALEVYRDVGHCMSETHMMYIHGFLGLKERAYAEKIYFATCAKLRELLKLTLRAHREILNELNEKLAHKFTCNFSLFRLLPDAWAIKQVFPIVPLSGLEKRPMMHGILHDITCDSDGRVDVYVNNYGLENTLPLTSFDKNKPYLLGVFLLGAYQEILGNLHNLFGDTHSIHVEMMQDGSYQLTNEIQGDTVESTLHHVNFDGDLLLQSYQYQIDKANLSSAECDEFLQDLSRGLKGYTYLEEYLYEEKLLSSS